MNKLRKNKLRKILGTTILTLAGMGAGFGICMHKHGPEFVKLKKLNSMYEEKLRDLGYSVERFSRDIEGE